MPTFLYRCPNTRQTVQGYIAEEIAEDTYEQIACIACRRLHFVNRQRVRRSVKTTNKVSFAATDPGQPEV
jgi:hypothetical protein